MSLNHHHRLRSSSDYYAHYIEIYGRDRALQSGRKLHAYLIINALLHSTYLSFKLIGFYTQCRQLFDARNLFNKIPISNIGRWVVLIGAYSRQGFYQETLSLLAEMQREGLKPNNYIIPSVIKASANLPDRRTGEIIHGVAIRSLFDGDSYIDSSLVDMYSKCGRVVKARNVFDRMAEKDLVAWNSMVSGYAQQGFAREALGLVEEMKINGENPNILTWNALIAGFAQVGDEVMVLDLFRTMRDNGVQPDVYSWTSVISGFVQNFRNNQAFDMFKQMVSAGIRPNSYTISGLLPACATVADLIRGKEIHGYALVSGIEEDVFVSSAFIDMYSKCSAIFEAEILFKKMSTKNTVTWNSMIFGYANHGYSIKAIELFNEMTEKKGCKPDHLTFTAVLTACCHAGMVDVGQCIFHLMSEEHGIEPRLEHYACLVDLIGRAGELVEAYELIKNMPIKPDSFVWGALLGACRNHGNVELAEITAKHVSELEPKSAGSSLLMSSLYADNGNWGDVERLKKVTKKKRLRRNVGCSWIGITT
ncbi:hypothetical protein GIB67_034002 [Kingdonia uniflora]|uniref:Pentatricopeptide repeat-containing protein n=1 Tax=Kingdonia uniflora TaxID=39325 RepID=A0A7J7M614_9MAGN|nr:hypothetical protein GIB67_034002 [Kingdonia uniflora]